MTNKHIPATVLTLEQARDKLRRIAKTLGDLPGLGSNQFADAIDAHIIASSGRVVVTIGMVERACASQYEHWKTFHQWEREEFRKRMSCTLDASLNPAPPIHGDV